MPSFIFKEKQTTCKCRLIFSELQGLFNIRNSININHTNRKRRKILGLS